MFNNHLTVSQQICRFCILSVYLARAIAQAVSRRLLTAETRVRILVTPCGICGVQSGIGIGFSPSPSVSRVNIIPLLLYIRSILSGRWTKDLLEARSHIVLPHRNNQHKCILVISNVMSQNEHVRKGTLNITILTLPICYCS